MGAVQLTEARVFEMLGRLYAECQERLAHEAVLGQQIGALAEAYAALEQRVATAPAPMATDV